MELKLTDGQYVADGRGALARASGVEELIQRIEMKLRTRRGSFAVNPEYGSRLYLLHKVKPSERGSVAEKYVSEALADESGLTLSELKITDSADDTIRLYAAFESDSGSVYLTTVI